jgi:hypothetical protein
MYHSHDTRTIIIRGTKITRPISVLDYWCTQGWIKGFVGPRYFSSLSSLGHFGDSKSTVGTTVYSRLSGVMEGEGMRG